MKRATIIKIIILFFATLYASGNRFSNFKNSAFQIHKDIFYCDIKKQEATILYNGKNILSLKVETVTMYFEPIEEVTTTFGNYLIKGDTVYISSPLREPEGNKTNSFWAYKNYSAANYDDAFKLADSLLHTYSLNSDRSLIEKVFSNSKALIKNGNLIYL